MPYAQIYTLIIVIDSPEEQNSEVQYLYQLFYFSLRYFAYMHTALRAVSRLLTTIASAEIPCHLQLYKPRRFTKNTLECKSNEQPIKTTLNPQPYVISTRFPESDQKQFRILKHLYTTFVKNSEKSFLLRKHPLLQTWDPFQVRTGADEQQTEDQ